MLIPTGTGVVEVTLTVNCGPCDGGRVANSADSGTLIENLGAARRELLESFMNMTTSSLNEAQLPGTDYTVSDLIHHIHAEETAVARAVLGAQANPPAQVTARPDEELRAALVTADTVTGAPDKPYTARQLIALLERSRFSELQRVFNKAHVAGLQQAAMHHPVYGTIRLDRLLATIYIHDRVHAAQIADLTAAD